MKKLLSILAIIGLLNINNFSVIAQSNNVIPSEVASDSLTTDSAMTDSAMTDSAITDSTEASEEVLPAETEEVERSKFSPSFKRKVH